MLEIFQCVIEDTIKYYRIKGDYPIVEIYWISSNKLSSMIQDMMQNIRVYIHSLGG